MKFLASVVLAAALTACGGSSGTPSPAEPVAAEPVAAEPVAAEPSDDLRARLLGPDRRPEDQALDAGRKPVETIAFIGVRDGMKVAELCAGSGYTTELLARAVGPTGVVYGQNSKMILGFAKDAWPAHLAMPAMKNVVRVDREFADPLPPEATGLDAVVMNLFYHDLYWTKDDRDAMNRKVLAALKPGGVYVIIDHSGRPGTGSSEVQTLHRIEESVVVADVEKAGFKLKERGDFLRNPADARDWNASPMSAERRGTSDRFALKFVKP